MVFSFDKIEVNVLVFRTAQYYCVLNLKAFLSHTSVKGILYKKDPNLKYNPAPEYIYFFMWFLIILDCSLSSMFSVSRCLFLGFFCLLFSRKGVTFHTVTVNMATQHRDFFIFYRDLNRLYMDLHKLQKFKKWFQVVLTLRKYSLSCLCSVGMSMCAYTFQWGIVCNWINVLAKGIKLVDVCQFPPEFCCETSIICQTIRLK